MLESKYLDSLDCFSESSVERTVEKIISLKTTGIKEDLVSDYDCDKIDFFFRSSITFRDRDVILLIFLGMKISG